MLSTTIAIIIVTCLVSFVAFNNEKLIDSLIFYPPAITKQNQWYRFFTCGFIHADIPHLAFNMYSFYMFGQAIEEWFQLYIPSIGKVLYLAFYVLALIFCLLPTYFKNKNNYQYKSLGASGAVSSVVFAFILLAPKASLNLIIIPGLNFPAWVFGAIYLVVSAYLAKKGNSYINHSAHFWGAIFGIIFIGLITKFSAFTNLVQQIF
jgi:membrane associated rhomboid family serine protease